MSHREADRVGCQDFRDTLRPDRRSFLRAGLPLTCRKSGSGMTTR